MAIEAIYPKMNLSKRNQAHKVYPYLLNGVSITKVNQVWSTDISVPCKAAWKMRAGLSQSIYRDRLQTTVSGFC